MKIIKNVMLAIFILITLLYIYMNISVWFRVDTPANNLLMIGNMLLPNVLLQSIIICVLVIIIAAAIQIITRKKISIYTIFTICVYSLIIVNNIVMMFCIKNAKIYDNPAPTIKADDDVSFELYDYTIDAQEINPNINSLKVYIPGDKTKNTIFVYLPYGGYEIHSNPDTFDYLKNTLLTNGYSFAYLSARTKNDANIVEINDDLNSGLIIIDNIAKDYGIENTIVSGGSAGGTLALLSAYTSDNEIVDGVAAFYPIVDMYFYYKYFINDNELSSLDKLGNKLYSLSDSGGHANLEDATADILLPLLTGTPDDAKEYYDFGTVNNHIHEDLPPTLFIHGTADSMAPIKAAEELYNDLYECSLPVDFLKLQFAEHAFDSIFPKNNVVTNKAYSELIAWLKKNFD